MRLSFRHEPLENKPPSVHSHHTSPHIREDFVVSSSDSEGNYTRRKFVALGVGVHAVACHFQ